ncbi:MAG: FAD-dependent oxidoreductase [Anaerolineae bacterium]
MEPSSNKVGAALVVGGGIAGVQAALDLANAGIKVYMVERETAIGGKMVQLDKTFPTNDCAMCISSPKLVDAGRHPNIELLTNAELTHLEGTAGHFTATVRLEPRYIDPEKCTSCGDCAEVCPIVLPNPFNAYLDTRTAVHRRYPQAVPNAYAISKRGISPCRDACPAHQRAQGYIALIREGRYDDALRVIKEDNPFPGICGRICNHRCEDACNRGKVDEPISISALKRFVTDQVYAKPRQPVTPAPRTREERIAVVGAGPAGLTCAQDLVKLGYGVTAYEALPVAGGMFRVGVPEFRMPARIADREVQDIVDLGVDLRLNHRIDDVNALFEEGYDAVFLAVGAHEGRKLRVPGADLPGSTVAIHLLRDVRLGNPVQIGKDVIVIGGGSVAVDAARIAVRLGAEHVRMVCLESREQMPCHAWEIDECEQEGIEILPARNTLEVTGRDGRVAGLRCERIVFRGFADGRPDFDVIPGTEQELPADTVVFAIGQAVGLALIPQAEEIGVTARRTVDADLSTMATGRAGVFAAGDAVTGTGFVIEAVAAGHRAAESIHRYLRGEEDLAGPPKPELPVVELTEEEIAERRARGEIRGTGRVPMPALPVDQRLRRDAASGEFVEVERGYTPELAAEEAARCLQCALCSECLSCWYECKVGAVEHDQVAEERALQVGAVVLSPGYALSDPAESPEWGYGRYENVVTSLEMERMLSASGPTQGHIARPSDGAAPERIAFLQCVGSRDQAHHYCSSVCCMYATKEAMLLMEHVPGVEVHVFQMDMRAFGKNFDAYYRRGQEQGIIYHRCRLSVVHEDPVTRQVVVRYQDEEGALEEARFDMLVLSVGMEPPEEAAALAEVVGIDLNEHGFAARTPFHPVETSRDGVYVCGAFAEPKDIPDSVVEAGGAAASALAAIGEARGTLVAPPVYPPEKMVAAADEPRIGCFICSCGSNIAGVIDVAQVTAYAASLPNVAHAENTTYTCSADSLKRIQECVEEYNLNRVIVASCTPRTHEPIFRDTIRGAGLNPYLFEMANIRDQGSWVHRDEPGRATEKAKDLVRMAVARSRLLFPLHTEPQAFDHRALVVGGGVAGMTAALNLAEQGYDVHLVEREPVLGGRARQIDQDALGGDVRAFLSGLLERVAASERIEVHAGYTVAKHDGYVGNMRTTLQEAGGARQQLIEHGVVIVATGAEEYAGPAYGLGSDPRIMTQGDLEARLAEGTFDPRGMKQVVMIQCVGPWDEDSASDFYCSRVCCTVAAKNALRLKELNPALQVFVLYKDIRTYGFREQIYEQARRAGVSFVRYEEARKPEVRANGDGVQVTVTDPTLHLPVALSPDAVVLSAAMVPAAGTRELAERMRFACTLEGFMLEAHLKLQPVDFPSEGAYLCGAIQYPKFLDEAIAQAQAAAARAASILSQDTLQVGGPIAVVDTEQCTGCLTCVRVCPYDVPVINAELLGAGGIRGAAEIAPAACRGCGLCAGECPAKAIQLQHHRDEQLLAKIEALFEGDRRAAEVVA